MNENSLCTPSQQVGLTFPDCHLKLFESAFKQLGSHVSPTCRANKEQRNVGGLAAESVGFVLMAIRTPALIPQSNASAKDFLKPDRMSCPTAERNRGHGQA
jgi:hypothetical protein